MGRARLTIVVSYVVMLVVAFLAFAAAFVLFGSDAVFKAGICEASTTWIGASQSLCSDYSWRFRQ
jgi:hypothetical protein